MAVAIRPMREEDLAIVARLNDAAVPAVNALPVGELRRLADGGWAAVAVVDGAVCGGMIALPPGFDYRSENYAWFSQRFIGPRAFLYVDRIVIAASSRRLGAASRLYAAAFAHARAQGFPRVTCEVNIRPANEASLAFHQRSGFREIGQQDTCGGAKRVALLSAASGDGPEAAP
ncbi:MAG TPA: GNAT family N-acetyltransferase [Planctomycetota bacterium]|nr:GNAT family N-acetyltransferase [Planctomycetota bacterium]